MDTITKAQADAAAKWWRSKIERPNYDNGDSSSNGGITFCLAALARQEVGENVYDRFEQALSESIIAENPRWIDTDYAPCQLLADAMKKAGIPAHNAPWKTQMHIEPGISIKASCGYAAESQDVPFDSVEA